MSLEVVGQRTPKAQDVLIKSQDTSTLYKVSIIVDPIGRNEQGVWFVAYVHNKAHDPKVSTCTGIWGCKSTAVNFNRTNPDPNMSQLDSREYWRMLALDILDTYLSERPEVYKGPRPTRFDRIIDKESLL